MTFNDRSVNNVYHGYWVAGSQGEPREDGVSFFSDPVTVPGDYIFPVLFSLWVPLSPFYRWRNQAERDWVPDLRSPSEYMVIGNQTQRYLSVSKSGANTWAGRSLASGFDAALWQGQLVGTGPRQLSAVSWEAPYYIIPWTSLWWCDWGQNLKFSSLHKRPPAF